jgi:hypothetical protein
MTVHQHKDTEDVEKQKQKTQWASIILASIILFLVAVQFSIYFASLWPYLNQVINAVLLKVIFLRTE